MPAKFITTIVEEEDKEGITWVLPRSSRARLCRVSRPYRHICFPTTVTPSLFVASVAAAARHGLNFTGITDLLEPDAHEVPNPCTSRACHAVKSTDMSRGEASREHLADTSSSSDSLPRAHPSSDSDSDASANGETFHLSRNVTNLSTSANRGYATNTATDMDQVEVPSNNNRPAHLDDTNIQEQHDSVAPLNQSSARNYSPTGYQSSNASSSPWTTQSYTTNPTPISTYGWDDRQRGMSGSALDGPVERKGAASSARPGYSRTNSNVYAPQRRPSQHPAAPSSKHRNSNRPHRLNPDADYRAQKTLYLQRVQREDEDQDAALGPESYPPSLGHSSGTEDEEESPSVNDYVEGDSYDQETLLYYGEDTSPSADEIKVPANRERLEWHSMLTNVLTGDVVRQEKKRITGTTDAAADKSLLSTEIWHGVRARVTGRTLAVQKKILEDQRSKIAGWIEDIVSFEIRGEGEVGKSPKQQVEDIVGQIEKCERLYPTRKAFETAHPRAATDAYRESCDALISWHNTTALINTELGILQAWVGNEELDFHKRGERNTGESMLQDDATFIDRVLKEDGLKQLQDLRIGTENSKDVEETTEGFKKKLSTQRPMILAALNDVVYKAKRTLISNAEYFQRKHLPPYIEELLTLINFPSRLLADIIRVRLSYAGNMRDSDKQGLMMAEQMISQYQQLLTLAVKIKTDYLRQAAPEPGWDLPPCLDENYDEAILDALKYYFRMLGYKLSANRNSFKEAEILDQEWEFSNALGRYFEGGDVEVAEQFSSLTALSLKRLTTHFEKELKRRPNEVAGPEMDRRYKSILDSVRVRQRKLFRFSRLLTQTFENASEYSIAMPQHHLEEVYENLLLTGYCLVTSATQVDESLFIFAPSTLATRPRLVESLLGTCYRDEQDLGEPNNPYLVILNPETPLSWDGPVIQINRKLPHFGLKLGKLRVVAEGSERYLAAAREAFMQNIGMDLDLVNPQRANLPRVEHRLASTKKTAYKLSNTIMDSVQIIQGQLVGLECQELIQSCFAFATEFGQRSILYMDYNRRQLNNIKLTGLALDWIAFICDDCVAADRKTFRWAVQALEFAMNMTRGQKILNINDQEYAKLRTKVAGCMSLLISHFDIMGARSTVAAQAEKQRMMDAAPGRFRLDTTNMRDDEESARIIREQWMEQLEATDAARKEKEATRQALGHVLEDSNDADRSLTFLSSSATNVTMRWQQGQFVGGGTFGSVYIGHNLDSGQLMAVKEIRLQDPQLIPKIAGQIREEMSVLQILEHPNMVKYYGIEVHRDKVFIFMEYCAGGSLAGLLEHGRIDDESFILVYTLQMLEGLAYLHESGVVHRDIKPENILLDHTGLIKFVDFGAARVIAQQTGRTVAHKPSSADGGEASSIGADPPAGAVQRGKQRSMTGTPMYMSPEMINPESVRKFGVNTTSSGHGSSPNSPSLKAARPGAVDIWSLGCVVLEMATGRRPWASLDNEWAIMYNIAQGNPPQLPSKEQLSEQGVDFLKRCFDRDPTKRATAAELLQHEWLMGLKNQLQLEAQTPVSETSCAGMSRSSTGIWSSESGGSNG